MKKYIYIIIAGLTVLLLSTAIIQHNKIKKQEQKIEALVTTVNAYSNENSELKESNREFKLTVDQLNYFSDSLLTKLNKARKDLKIKDKEIERLEYLASIAQKTDTIRFRDTIFRDSFSGIDTTINDNNGWYRCYVGLEYPNKVTVGPTFKSEKYVVTSKKRENIDPPKKCWLARLFQKKHDVIIVDVVESNPYITNEKERFITIIK